MPRIARKSLESCYQHIMVQGIEKRYIFEKECYKTKYMELLYSHKEEFNINIIAYCIMDNHAHMLLEAEKIESISKFMHKINFKFAQFYNFVEKDRKGYVFRDRFLSEPILNERQLYNCIKYIHNNPIKANIVSNPSQYKYSNYKEYIKKNKDYSKYNEDIEYIFKDVDTNEKEIINIIIKKYLKLYDLKLNEINKKINRYVLRKIILELRCRYKITYRKIAEELGISLSKIKRVGTKNEPFLPRPQKGQKGEVSEISDYKNRY